MLESFEETARKLQNNSLIVKLKLWQNQEKFDEILEKFGEF